MMVKQISALMVLIVGILFNNAIFGEALHVDSVPVETIRHQRQVVLGGIVVPARRVTIAARLPGRVEYIAGEEGDHFAYRTPLIAIDDAALLAERSDLLTRMARAEASLRSVGGALSREPVSPQSRNSISGMGFPTLPPATNFANMLGITNIPPDRPADHRSVQLSQDNTIEQARSAHMQAALQLQQIEAQLRDVVGRAPFNGLIIEKMVEVGDVVQPGQPLINFADGEALQVQIDVPVRLMAGINPDETLPATLDSGDTSVNLQVAELFTMADPVRQTVSVKFHLPHNVPAQPGMYVEVRVKDFTTPVEEVPVISESAVVQRGSLSVVYLLNSKGEREMHAIRKGSMLADGRVVVLSGLRGGERLINNPHLVAAPDRE